MSRPRRAGWGPAAALVLALGLFPAAIPGAAQEYKQAPPTEDLQRRQEEWADRRRLGGWLVVGGFALSVVIVGVVRTRQRRRRRRQ